MRRIISIPDDVFKALCAHCVATGLPKSEAVRRAATSLAEQVLPEPEDGRWSQNYRGQRRCRIALILTDEFDLAMRRAAARWRRSVNAYYTHAVQAWLVSQGAFPAAR